jgi:hypothetical protein
MTYAAAPYPLAFTLRASALGCWRQSKKGRGSFLNQAGGPVQILRLRRFIIGTLRAKKLLLVLGRGWFHGFGLNYQSFFCFFFVHKKEESYLLCR